MLKCPKCQYENRDGASICDRCGALLIDPSTTKAFQDTDYEEGDPRWGSARFKDTLVIDIVDTDKQFSFSGFEVLEMGRVDPQTGDSPSIDLTDIGALEKGVSRRHAKIVYRDGTLHIVDNNSANGTYLNGQRLVSGQPRILRDGDDIRLGHMVMRVTYKAATP